MNTLASRQSQVGRQAGQNFNNGFQAAVKNAGAGLVASLGVGVVAGALAKAADSYTRFTNSLKVAGLEGSRLEEVQNRLYESAIRNGVALESMGQLYGSLSAAAKSLGKSQEDILKFTDLISNAIRVTGQSAESAQGALTQLSQAIGGGKVAAEEYNSIKEQLRPVLQAAADASTKYAGSVAAITKEVKGGKMEASEFWDVLMKGEKILAEQAGKAPLTLAAGMENLNSAFTKYVGEQNSALGVTNVLSGALGQMANNMDTLMASMVIVGTYAGSVYATSMARAGITAVQGAMNTAKATQEAARVAALLSNQNLATATSAQRLAAFQNTMTVSMTRGTIATRAATLATRSLNVAMGFLTSSFGIGLLITGVAVAMMALAGSNAAAEQSFDRARQRSDEFQESADALADAHIKLEKDLQDVVDASLDAARAAGVAGSKYDDLAVAASNAAAHVRALTDAQRAQLLLNLQEDRRNLTNKQNGGNWLRDRVTVDDQERIKHRQTEQFRAFGIREEMTGTRAPRPTGRYRGPGNRIYNSREEAQRAIGTYRGAMTQRQREAYDAYRGAQATVQGNADQLANLDVQIEVVGAAIGTPTIAPPAQRTGAGSDGSDSASTRRGGGRTPRAKEYDDDRALHDAKMAHLSVQIAMAATMELRHQRENEYAASEYAAQLAQMKANDRLTQDAKDKIEIEMAATKVLEDQLRAEEQALEILERDQAIERASLDRSQEMASIEESRLSILASVAKRESDRWRLEDQATQSRRAREREARRLEEAQLRHQATIERDLRKKAELIAEADGVRARGVAQEGVYRAEDEQNRMDRRSEWERYRDEINNTEWKFDDTMLKAFQSLEDGMAGLIDGTKTFAEVWRDVATSIIADIARIAVRQMILRPIMAAMGVPMGGGGFDLSGLFGGKPSAVSGGGDNGGLIPSMLSRRAIGDRHTTKGAYQINEAGTEGIILPNGSQIIPTGDMKSLLRPSSASRPQQTINLTTVVNATNALLRQDLENMVARANMMAVAQAKNETIAELAGKDFRRMPR